MFWPAKSSFFRNSRGVTIQDKQALVNHRQVLRIRKSHSFIEVRKEEFGWGWGGGREGVVLNKSSLEENENLKWWQLFTG